MIKIIFIFSFFILHPLLFGCSPVSVLASGGATGMVVAEGDRSFGEFIDDTTIKLNISAKFLQTDNNLFININSNVIDGRVLLTGLVDTQEDRINIIKSVWEVKGVKEIINEIEVGDKKTLKEYANDLWINTQIKGLAAKTIGLRSLSYNFETIKGKVYIAGLTSRKEQLDLLIQNVKTIKGVREIVNYVVVKE